MKIDKQEIIEELMDEKKDLESLDAAMKYLDYNFDSSINDPVVYRDYLVSIYQIIRCLKFKNSNTWWNLNLLIRLQNFSVTSNNMISTELIRRYVEYRNEAVEYIGVDKLKIIIDSLPSYMNNRFSLAFQKAKKDNGSDKLWNAILNMKAISDQTDLGLDVEYKQERKSNMKVIS